MPTYNKTIEVDVPVRVAYHHWTQFEDFPRFLDSVERVVERDEGILDWTVKFGERPNEWSAEITERSADVRVAWKRVSGEELTFSASVSPWSSGQNACAVSFESLHAERTRITLRLDIDEDEEIGADIGNQIDSIVADLQRFKQFAESGGGPLDA